jgi:O-antigen/teichoic acid export membrane protein
MSLIPTFFTAFIVPFYAQRLLSSRIHGLSGTPHQQFIRASCAMAALAFPVCGLLMLLAPWLLGYCLGPAFIAVVTPLRILLISAALGSVASVSITYLATRPRQTARQRLGLAAALLNIVLAIIFIRQWGLVGAALASSCAQGFSALGSMLLCHLSLKQQVLLLPKEV